MEKKLSAMTTQEFKESLSIAGNPDSCMGLMQDIMAAISARVNVSDLAQLGNVRLVLRKVEAEIKAAEKAEYNRQHPKRKQ